MITPPTVGTWGVDQFLPEDLVRDVATDVTEYGNVSAPFMTWVSRTPQKLVQTLNEDYFYQEEQFDAPSHILQGGLTGGAATEANVKILSPEYVSGDTVAHPDSGQHMIVDSSVRHPDPADLVYGGYSIVTLRGVGGNIQHVAGDMTVVPCGIAIGDGQFFPEPKSSKPKQLQNTVTYKSYSVEVTFAAGMATTYYGSQMQHDNRRMLEVTKRNMERDLTHSNYEVKTGYTQTNPNGSAGARTIRFTRGLLSSITQNVQTYTGDLTQETWEEFLSTSIYANAYHGSPNKLVFFGPGGRQRLTQDLDKKVRILSGPGQNKYGLSIEVYQDFEGHQLFFFTEDNFRNVSPLHLGAMVVDPKFVRMRHHGSNSIELFDSSNPRQTARSVSMWFNYGLECRFDGAHGLLKQAS